MTLSKLAIALISPLGTALALGVLAVLLGAFGKRRAALRLGSLALAWLWLWSLPVASMWLRGQVEEDFPPMPLQTLPSAPAIVVLGGAIDPPRRPGDLPDLEAAADRVWHAARLYHAGKAPLLVLSGGSDRSVSATSEAEAMRVLLRDLGVPDEAMLLESESRNTRENARFTAEKLRERGIDRVLLVTSALHMHRALRHFDAESLQVIPAATDHEARQVPPWQRWLPDTGALDGSGRAMKEIVGRFANDLAPMTGQ